ncbi:uncharacterized protein LOC106092775 [Stomoxys calcitrans]|uniref:uncharacterized protein LOC106092775 n=1 Tax=Stomoxys calcitrans TaxID=35570 RepID=UPI0027E24116|nr:uncharacterized protein LOC106092775 [Stomoxys calcitrans]
MTEEGIENKMAQKICEVQQQISKWEKLSSHCEETFRIKLQSSLTLLKIHVKHYQRIMITRGRRGLQRRRKRHLVLRNMLMQMVEDLQIQFMEIIPLCTEPSVLVKIFKEKTDEKFREWEEKVSRNNTSTEKSYGLFEDIAKYSEEQWNEAFHMTKNTYNMICPPIKAAFEGEDTSAEALVAMCINTMASGINFRSLGLMINKPPTYVRSILYKFLDVLISNFERQYMTLPLTQDEVTKVCKGFSRASHLPPCCLGVLCVFELPTFTYIKEGCKSYGMDRVIVQTLIDDRLQFRRVKISHHFPDMLLSTPNEISDIEATHFGGTELPIFIAAPTTYPLCSWLMQKFENPQQECEHNFNRALSHLNIFRELALQRLFGRWQILSSSEFIEPESKALLVKACCILHNILETCGEAYSEDWNGNIDISKYHCQYEVSKSDNCKEMEEDASEKRNRIANCMVAGDKDNV